MQKGGYYRVGLSLISYAYGNQVSPVMLPIICVYAPNYRLTRQSHITASWVRLAGDYRQFHVLRQICKYGRLIYVHSLNYIFRVFIVSEVTDGICLLLTLY